MPMLDYWNSRVERAPLEELQEIQERKLRQLVDNVYRSSQFYRKRFNEAGVKPEDIKTLEDITKLPFTFKKDLRDNYPTNMFCVPLNQVVRFHVSSGTTGKPTVVGYTRGDVDCWTTSLARALTACGLGRGDIMQVSYGYGLFTGGLGLHYGAEEIGASVIPMGVGNTERQIELMVDLHATAIACTPSYLLHMNEVAKKMNINIKEDTDLKVPSSAPSPGRWRPGSVSRIPWASRPMIFMAPLRCQGRCSRNVKSRTASTSGRTTSYWRSSIRTATRSRKARRESWSSRRCPKRRCR